MEVEPLMSRSPQLLVLLLIGQMIIVVVGDGSKGPSSNFPSLITVSSGASVPEQRAAEELAAYLNNISASSSFRVQPTTAVGQDTPQIAVGHDAAILLGVHSHELVGLGLEGILASTNLSRGVPAGSVALTGSKDAPRGALYAMVEFLEAIGVQFLDRLPGGTKLPTELPVSLPTLDKIFVPPLEYRQQYQFGCNNFGVAEGAPGGVGDVTMDWNLHRRLNKATLSGESPTAGFGGSVVYAKPPGFAHTSYALLSPNGAKTHKATPPPADLFSAHNEWFWPRDDPAEYGQLCWSNASLLQFIIGNLKQQLKTQPEATIVSVSQNDNHYQCQDPLELKINEEEGTAGGALFRAVNIIADGLKDSFPNVSVDALAYEWSRSPPKITKPRENVIIRLSSIECNFGMPLSDPSNAKFHVDLKHWANVSNRTFVWNYITNFRNYVAPFPDWYSLGPNIKFFQRYKVTGIFEEGAYRSPGSDLMELKDYVASSMMWDTTQDDRQLISTFLASYYGSASPFVHLYMDTMHKSVADSKYFMHTAFTTLDAPFLTPIALLTSAKAFVEGRAVVSGIELERLNRASMAVYYPIIMRWVELQSFARIKSITWPLEPTLDAAFEVFAAAYNATTAVYGNVPPMLPEGSLAAMQSSIFKSAASCSSELSTAKLPLSVNASRWYPADAPHSLLGLINEGALQGWVEFTLALPSLPSWEIGGVTAVPNMKPVGLANHSILLDGKIVHRWIGPQQSLVARHWSPTTKTNARKLRIESETHKSWVDWVSITVYTCVNPVESGATTVLALKSDDNDDSALPFQLDRFGSADMSVIESDGDGASRFVQDRFAISFFLDPTPTDKAYEFIRGANFTVLLGANYPNNQSEASEMFRLCAKYNLKCIANLKGWATPKSIWKDSWTFQHPLPPTSASNWGFYIKDEPKATEYSALAETVANIRAQDPQALSFINLDGSKNISGVNASLEWGTPEYHSYVQEFVDIVRPDILCFDHYPSFGRLGIASGAPDQRGQDTRESYVANLRVVSGIARKASIPMWLYFNIVPFRSHEDPTEAQIRWQVMTAIAYGVKGLLYFAFHPLAGMPGGLVRCSSKRGLPPCPNPLQPTHHYYQAQRINSAVLSMAPVLMRATIIGVADLRYTRVVNPGPVLARIAGEGACGILDISRGDWTVSCFSLTKHNSTRNATRALLISNFEHAYTQYATIVWACTKTQPASCVRHAVHEIDQRTGLARQVQDDEPDAPGFQQYFNAGDARLFVVDPTALGSVEN